MALRDGLFAAFSSAMLVVALAPRRSAQATAASLPHAAVQQNHFNVQTAWLAQRESAVGDWEAVNPPLREGDELQLTVLSSEDADIYVLDGDRRQIFPPPGAPPSLSRVRARWPYAIPGPHRTWRLDQSTHDKLWLVAARHPLPNPAAFLDRPAVTTEEGSLDVELPLRDGRPGVARSHLLSADEDVLVDSFDAR